MTTMTTDTVSETQQQKRKEYADGLRAVADWVENTDADLTTLMFSPHTFNLFAWNKEDFDDLSSAIGGLREKTLEGTYAIVRRRFGPHRVEVNINRDKVCKRVQVGEAVVPAQPAVEEHVEPVYEWQCEGFTVTS